MFHVNNDITPNFYSVERFNWESWAGKEGDEEKGEERGYHILWTPDNRVLPLHPLNFAKKV